MIRGLSPYALAVIARLEWTRDDLRPGKVAAALRMWRGFVRNPYRRLWVDYPDNGCGIFECCGAPWEARQLLETVMLSMSERSARELHRLVERLDEMY
ncbi:hypothetical protein [Streptacidiphilus sp. EB129]|uniref:hypothetical protein n=1 Tax=Streptacidiphilus sp. EB129 TaxID=3156262 RepID=UPI003516F066